MRILNLGCGNDMYGDVRVDMVETDATTLIFNLNSKFPFEDNQFDEIYCKSALEHIKNLGTFSDKCYRVLKKGGKIYVKTDYAGFLLAHILKKHEPNRALDIQYNAGRFGHNQQDDHHYALFVPSHLKYLFGKFQNHYFNYVNGSRGVKRLLLSLLPKQTGYCHIEMEAWK